MQNDKLRAIRDFIMKRGKFLFPVVIVAAAAVTVTVALNVGRGTPAEIVQTEQETASAGETDAQETQETQEQTVPEVPLVANEDSDIYSLVATYYNAVALGDTDTILSICDEMSDTELIRFQVNAQYIENYPALEIYTKAGPEEGSTIAYVYYRVIFQNQTTEFPGYQALYICTDENGSLYIKRGENTDDVIEYIRAVNAQDDVVEFNNRITEEYNQLMLDQPELLEYLSELDQQVNKEVGVILAEQSASESESGEDAQTQEQGGEAADAQEGETAGETDVEASQENTVQYATATTTVNVRVSDSEQADRLGKVDGGTTVQVLEERVNGWTKVLYEGQEGYIKSEFLQAAASAESSDGATVIGTVTATTNINVRASASETAEKLGVLAGGDSAELLANENGWCRINYNGQVGYVKAEYVQ